MKMNFKKITAGAIASVIAASTLAISASADHLYQPSEEVSPYLTTDGGNWLFRIYNETTSQENGPAISREFDPWDIAQISIYAEMTVADDSEWTLEDYDVEIDDNFQGAVIYSANGGYFGSTPQDSPMYDEENGASYYNKFNWPSYDYWALPAKDDTYEGRPTDVGGAGTNTGYVDYTRPVVAEYIKQYNYGFTLDLTDDRRWPDDPDTMAGLYRIGYAAWSNNNGIFKMKVNLLVCRDDNGEILIATDGLGNEISGEDAEALIAQWKEEGENEVLDAPADDGSSSDGASDPADDGSDNSDENTSTSATTTTPASTEASGDNTTLFVIIGIVAAVVIVVIIIIVVSAKKKKS